MTADVRGSRARGGLAPREWASVLLLYLLIGAVTVAAFGLLLFLSNFYGARLAGAREAVNFAALGFIAYVLGLRHGVDADHIAAIDNVTRKLLQEGKRPLTVGTWFSLGHSTVVVVLIVGLVLLTGNLYAVVPALQQAGSVIGTLVSGGFLWVIGLLNVVIALEIYRIFREVRQGRYSERELEEQLTKRGFMSRYFGRMFRLIRRPAQAYPVGLLFGLGFDTATEILVIAISVGAALGNGLPLYAVLVFPLLFTAGMVLVDTTDAVTMRLAYGWAFARPLRKIYYNLTITVISVLVAWAVGAIELLQVVLNELGWTAGPLAAVSNVDLTTLGVAIVGIFVVTWGLSMAYYRYKRFDEIRLKPQPEASRGPEPGAGG